MYDEFRRVLCDELKLLDYHQESEIRDFFNFVQMDTSATHPGLSAMPIQQASKISLAQLVAQLKKLAPKSIGALIQSIFEKLWAETKKNNLSLMTVKTIFTEFDPAKAGYIGFEDFKSAIQTRLNVSTLTTLDIQVLA